MIIKVEALEHSLERFSGEKDRERDREQVKLLFLRNEVFLFFICNREKLQSVYLYSVYVFKHENFLKIAYQLLTLTISKSRLRRR